MLSAPWIFILSGIAWLIVAVFAIALCRAAALADQQAELAQVIELDDYRCTWDWPRDAA